MSLCVPNERNTSQNPFQIQIDSALPGQTTIGDLPVDAMQIIFSGLPPCLPSQCYKATCKPFAAYYHEPTIRKANDLLLKQSRLLSFYGICSRDHIQTYAEAVDLLEKTRKIILKANEFLPKELNVSPKELIANCDTLQTFFENAEEYFLVEAFKEYCPIPTDAPIEQRASTVRKWIKNRAKTLTSLELVDVHFPISPAKVFELKNLTFLSMDSCLLSWLTPQIKELKHLTHLILADNELSSLPDEISELKKLKFINLCCNKFESIPPVLKKLPSSVHICLADNPVTAQTPGMEEVHCQVHFDENEWHTFVSHNDPTDQVESSQDSSSEEECGDICSLSSSTLPQGEVINIAKAPSANEQRDKAVE
jgi:hypothetical protein